MTQRVIEAGFLKREDLPRRQQRLLKSWRIPGRPMYLCPSVDPGAMNHVGALLRLRLNAKQWIGHIRRAISWRITDIRSAAWDGLVGSIQGLLLSLPEEKQKYPGVNPVACAGGVGPVVRAKKTQRVQQRHRRVPPPPHARAGARLTRRWSRRSGRPLLRLRNVCVDQSSAEMGASSRPSRRRPPPWGGSHQAVVWHSHQAVATAAESGV
jgi:hypothetical protein